jgi:hypothetical protein
MKDPCETLRCLKHNIFKVADRNPSSARADEEFLSAPLKTQLVEQNDGSWGLASSSVGIGLGSAGHTTLAAPRGYCARQGLHSTRPGGDRMKFIVAQHDVSGAQCTLGSKGPGTCFRRILRPSENSCQGSGQPVGTHNAHRTHHTV